MYVIGGFELIIPVQATVRIFDSSMLPQLTITVGSGARSGPGVDLTFIAVYLLTADTARHSPSTSTSIISKPASSMAFFTISSFISSIPDVM